MKSKHGLTLSLVALIVLMLFPSLVTRVHGSGFVTPITIVISSKSDGDYHSRYHALTIDNPIPEVFWKGDWYNENPDAIIGISEIFSFYYRKTVELPPGQHVVEYAVSTGAGYGHWDATMKINGEVVALGEVTRHEHLTASFEVLRQQHDLTVALDAPASLEFGDSALLNATVTNWGYSDETSVELFLLVNGTVVDSVTIPELVTNSSYAFSYLWTSTVEASYNVTAYAPPVSGENITVNNVVTKVVNVRKRPVVYVDPRATTAGLGDTFVINVKVANVTDLYGYEFKLFWNTALLDCVNSALNTIWYPNDLIVKDEISENYNATHGRYFGAYCSTGASSFSGNTTLVSLTFEATGSGSCTLDIYDVILVDSKTGPIQDWDHKDSLDDGYVTIYGPPTTCVIRADGSVDPGAAPISSVDNVTYTLTSNIRGSIVVERDNIVVEGASFTVQGAGSGKGIDLTGRSNVTIKSMEIKAHTQGIYLYRFSNNTISGNNILDNDFGIWLEASANNSISGNNVILNAVGVWLEDSSNNSISGNEITECGMFGVVLNSSSNNILSGNNMTNNGFGIALGDSSNNILSGNSVTYNYADGFYLELSSNNTVSGNTVTNSLWGIELYGSSNNSIYHNNFVGNTGQVYTEDSVNIWDDGYPSGGNYWSDHNPPDMYSGPNQDISGSDGIGDIPYIIDGNNTDRYPLIYPYGLNPPLDLNKDGIINILDIVIVGLAFDSRPGDPKWNPVADIRQDGVVNILDVVMVGLHFGETY